jgi:hypothetical protein
MMTSLSVKRLTKAQRAERRDAMIADPKLAQWIRRLQHQQRLLRRQAKKEHYGNIQETIAKKSGNANN